MRNLKYDKGNIIIQELKTKMTCREIDMNKLNELNIQYLKPCVRNANRDLFLKGINNGESFDLLAKKYAKVSSTRIVVYSCKKFLYRSGLWKIVKPIWLMVKSIKTFILQRNIYHE